MNNTIQITLQIKNQFSNLIFLNNKLHFLFKNQKKIKKKFVIKKLTFQQRTNKI